MAPEPEDDFKDEKNPKPLDEDDIALLKTYVSILEFPTPTFSVSLSSSPQTLAPDLFHSSRF